MTLIVAIKCKDGVVIGADGAATYATPFGQQQTIRQTTVKKLEIIGENLVLGVSGPVGLGQAYAQEFRQFLANKNGRVPFKTTLEARKYFQDNMWKHAEPLWKNAQVIAGTVGTAALNDCNHGSILAFPVQQKSCLLQMTGSCAPEEASEQLPFVAIGSGQSTADPFLAFIRRLFWRDGLPTVGDGIFSAIWTLRYAIEANIGLTNPIQVVKLEAATGGSWKAAELSADELGEHFQMIESMEDAMREGIREKFANPGSIPALPANT
jgi:20S proteasome alpha/beta subunit